MAGLKTLPPHPALLLTHRKHRYLVIADLHLGFEAQLVQGGIHLRPTFTPILDDLLELIRVHQPHELLILGDVKASVDQFSSIEWDLIPRFFNELLRHIPVRIVPGNHDGALQFLLPPQVPLLDAKGVLLGSTALLHGHTRPDPRHARAGRFVMGHAHPIYARRGSLLTGQRVWLSVKTPRASLFDDARGTVEIVLLPVFNRELAIAGMATLRGEPVSPILRRVAGAVEEAVIMTLDGTVVGGLESLQYVLGR